MKNSIFKIKTKNIELLRTFVAITVSLAIVFLIILLISKDPGEAIYSFILGPLGSVRRFGSVIEQSIPLIFTGLSVILLQRAGFFNLAMEGAFFLAAAVAAAVILYFHCSVPVAMLAGAIAGGIVCAIPTVLKVKCNSNVLVTSLMLNYICLYVGLYIIVGHFLDPKINTAFSYKFPDGSQLTRLFSVTRINTGIFIALGSVLIVWFINNKTSFGFKVTMIGKNSEFAKYAGMKIDSLVILSSFIGGLFAGLGGTVDMFGMYTRFQYTGLTNYGWDGILIAILAKQKAKYVPFAALFLAYMRVGADVMAMKSDIPSEMISIITSVIIILVSAQSLLKRYKKKLIIRETKESEVVPC
jgi:simple sugar transport system permease protein